MEKLIIIDNPNEWNDKLKGFKEIDSYYSYEYGSVFAKIEKGRLYAAYYEKLHTKIFYSFIKRIVPNINESLFDIVTPYGYGGPFIDGDPKMAIEFYNKFSEYCRLNNILTETIRFHPLYENHRWFTDIFEINYLRQTTAVKLTDSLEEIRNNYTSMNRRNVKKAVKNGLTCMVVENNKKNLKIFMEIYVETMQRNNAIGYYYFDESFFIEQMKDTSISKTYLLFTKWEDEIIGGAIVMVGKNFSHYHLGASKTNFLYLKPNNLLFDFMIEFCKLKGSKLLHLGGGYQEDDGLFQFKTSFTNNNNYSYYIGKRIYDLNLYNLIAKKAKEEFELNENYFPIYRACKEKNVEVQG